jgi:2-polyprenyl-6-methoxyphenol hydroxylase-like FAD-dependent oxidoreductase
MATPISVTVVGGGIAGLTTAVALKNIGYQVRVIEKRKALDTVAQGLMLQPASLQALKRVSPTLSKAVQRMGQTTGDLSLHSALRNTSIGKLAQDEIIDTYGAPFITVPRKDFYSELVKEVGSDNIVLGKQFKEYFEDLKLGTCRAVCIGGSEYTSDIIIGAEGAYSMISEMIPLPYENRYRGTTCWSGIASGVKLEELEGATGIGFGAQRASGIMPMSDGRAYWWASYGTWFGPEFDPNGDHKTLLRDLFKEYQHGPLQSLIERTEDIICQDIYDKTPYPSAIGRGRATLVGDAAHLAAPTFATGADQAIEDAASLAYHLEQAKGYGTNVQHALRDYEEARFRKPRKISKFARTANNIFHAQRPFNQYLAAYAASLVWPVFKYRYLDDALSLNL